MIHIFDKSETLQAVIPLSDVIEDTRKETLQNGAHTYEFTVPSDLPEGFSIEEEGLAVIEDLDGHFLEFRIKEVDTNKKRKTVSAESTHLELRGDILRPTSMTGTATQWLDTILAEQSRWQRGIVESVESRTHDFDEYPTLLKSEQTMRKDFVLEPRYRVKKSGSKIAARYIDWLQRRGAETGKEFVYKKDIKGLRRIGNTKEMVTALIGLGKTDENGDYLTFKDVTASDKPAGQDWVGDSDALQQWGIRQPDGTLGHVFGKYENPDETSASGLLDQTRAELKRRIGSKLTYEMDVVLLERISGYEHESVRLGDTVGIKDETFTPAILLEARVIDIKRSKVDKAKDKVVLGDYREITPNTYAFIQNVQSRLFRKEGVIDSKTRYVRSTTAPTDTTVIWVDTSVTPNIAKTYDGTAWTKATPTEAAEVQAEKTVSRGTTAPSDTTVLWLDTSVTPNVLKRYDGTAWVKATPTLADEIAESTARKWAGESGADVTGNNTANNTSNVGGTAATTVESNANNSIQDGTSYDGASLSSTGGFQSLRSDGLVRMIGNATEGFVIQNRAATTDPWEDVFFVDTNGNVKFSGGLEGATGEFSGNLTSDSVFVGSSGSPSLYLKDYNSAGDFIGWSEITSGVSGETLEFSHVTSGMISEQLFQMIFDTIYADFKGDLTVDGKITVESWNSVTFQNGWSAFNSTSYPVDYYKDVMGIVRTRGLITGGASETVAFNLPAGYRPAYDKYPICLVYDGTNYVTGRLLINTAGDVKPLFSTENYVSLDGIQFRAG
jgi:phage minor structural protein